jgi:hypothetical protein
MVQAYQFLKKYGVTIGFASGGVLSVLAFLILIFGLPANADAKQLYEESAFNFGLFVTYFLFFIAIIVALVFPTIYMAKNFKESTKLLISLGVVLVIAVISYVLASGATTADIAKGVAASKMTEGNIKMTEGILYLGYLLFFAAIGAVIFSFVRPMLAKK